MKKYLLVALLLALFACKPPQQLSHSQASHTVDKTQVDTRQHYSGFLWEQGVWTRVTSDSLRLTHRSTVTAFDTDKPKDPATGMHPVKSITESEAIAASGKQESEEATANRSEEESYQSSDSTQKDIVRQEEQEHTQKKQLPNVVWWAASIVAVGVLILIFWGRIKKLFKIP